MKALYEILEISENASSKDIRRAYRKLSLKYHPDKNPGDPLAAEKFREVSEAYDTLGDEDARKIYAKYGEQKFHTKWQYEQAQREGKIKSGDGSFYGDFDLIETFTSTHSFEKLTKKGAWLLKFYAPWCVHCQHAIPHFKKAAVLLEDMAQVGVVNCEANQRLCQKLNIHSYPTIAYKNKDDGVDFEHYSGNHDPEHFYTFINENKNSHMELITSENYQTAVLDSDAIWLMVYSAGSWCPPCTQIKPFVRRTAHRLDGYVKVGAINCDENKAICQKEDVPHYPFFKLFPQGAGKLGVKIEMQTHSFPQMNMLGLIAEIAPLMMPAKDDEVSYRIQITKLLTSHDPDRVEEVDELLEDWDGREEDLIESLRDRYIKVDL